MASTILGLSAFYHDSAAALVKDGEVVAAAHEERGSRRKFDPRFPAHAVRTVLREAGLSISDVDVAVFSERPLLKTDRILLTTLAMVPNGAPQFVSAFGGRSEARFAVDRSIRSHLRKATGARRRDIPPVRFLGHHAAHAAGAFYSSPFENAAVLCVDSVGEWATTSAWYGEGARISPLWEQRFPHSLGLFYSGITRWLGLRANFDEYKVMGLAAYGQPRYRDRMLESLIDVAGDGSFRLHPDFLKSFASGRVRGPLQEVLGQSPQTVSPSFDRVAADVAASAQAVLEEVLLRMVRSLHQETGMDNLCLAGGVALNGKANGRIEREGGFRSVWAQPAPGDAGNALGAALLWHWRSSGSRRKVQTDALSGARLGTRVVDATPSPELLKEVARRLAKGEVVGWCRGRAEWGPRALGGRSILASPVDERMRDRLNERIKTREGYRPFAPVVRSSDAAAWFPSVRESFLARWMLTTVEVEDAQRRLIPAAVHVDGSARVQCLEEGDEPALASLLREFGELTGVPILINTSFNGPDEPIVDTEEDAFRAARRLRLDALVVGDRLLAEIPDPVRIPPVRTFGDFLPALATFVLAAWFIPSWRAASPAFSMAGALVAVGMAAWAWLSPCSFRAFRRRLESCFRGALALPASLLLIAVWAGVLVPLGFLMKLLGKDPLDLSGEASARKPPLPEGPFGAPY